MKTMINSIVFEYQQSGCDTSDIVYLKVDTNFAPGIDEGEGLSVASEAKLKVAVNLGNQSAEPLCNLVQDTFCIHTLVLES
jgi:hypothetical protein